MRKGKPPIFKLLFLKNTILQLYYDFSKIYSSIVMAVTTRRHGTVAFNTNWVWIRSRFCYGKLDLPSLSKYSFLLHDVFWCDWPEKILAGVMSGLSAANKPPSYSSWSSAQGPTSRAATLFNSLHHSAGLVTQMCITFMGGELKSKTISYFTSFWNALDYTTLDDFYCARLF